MFKMTNMYPALSPLWVFIDKFLLIMVFFTASYNNFVAKTVYATLIIRVGIPLVGRVRSEGLTKVVNDFKTLGPGLRASWAESGGVALSLLVGFAGVGAFLSNYLTRNNRVDKIAVTLVLAMALMKALSEGTKSLPFMVGRVITKDLFVLLLRPSPARNHHFYVALSGLTIGFLCCLPFAYFSKFTSDNIGYITGIIAIIVAIALFFVKKTPAKGKTYDSP